MNRADLELVVAIQAQGSLVSAAQALGVAAPVVTKRLAALEAHLGHRLFQRTTRRLRPTAEGETVCQRARVLIAGFQALEAELQERQSEPTGLIRLAATFGFGRAWLGPALSDFQAAYPRLEIQLELTEQLPDLAKDGFDAAVWLWSASSVQAAQWVSRRLAKNQRVLAASPAYLKLHGQPLTLDELQRHACLVARENGQGARGVTTLMQPFDTWALRKERARPAERVRIKGPLSSNSGEMVRDWCLSGRGIMLRSLWDISPLLASGDLVRVLPAWSMPDADIQWLAPYRSDAPQRLRLLLDFLLTRFAKEPWKQAVAVQTAP